MGSIHDEYNRYLSFQLILQTNLKKRVRIYSTTQNGQKNFKSNKIQFFLRNEQFSVNFFPTTDQHKIRGAKISIQYKI